MDSLEQWFTITHLKSYGLGRGSSSVIELLLSMHEVLGPTLVAPLNKIIPPAKVTGHVT